MKMGFDMLDGDGESIELTPIIDVLFLLLTFFILAATFTAPSMDVTLAEADNAAASQNQIERVTFSIDADGMVYHEKTVIEPGMISALLKDKAPDTAIVFNVDEAAPFNAFVGVMDSVKSCGYHNFSINANYRGQ